MCTPNHDDPVAAIQDGANEDTIHHKHMRVALDLVCIQMGHVALCSKHALHHGMLDLVVKLKLNKFFFLSLSL